MKVIEKGADRTAYVHAYVKGQVNPLNEYGQYIDAQDGAVCCYVAVEQGYELKIDGRFNGVTLTVAYDCIVDGVCRKANAYAGKSVQSQKNKKLDVESFLYETSDGTIDTQMSVTPFTGTTNFTKEASETIGTVEMRVYITRQFDVEQSIDSMCTYDNTGEDPKPTDAIANYKEVPPQFQMAFEKDCVTLEAAKSKREKKKLHAKRPGTEPWAIFRFHYRTKESIEAKKMEMSFDATNNTPAKQEAHPLELDSVPPLVVSTKPAGKNDGDTSVRTSSPAFTDVPATPIKGAKKSQSAQPEAIVNRKPKIKSDTIATNSNSEMEPFADAELATGFETPVIHKGLLERFQSTPTKTSYDAVGNRAEDRENSEDGITTSTKVQGDESMSCTPKSTPKKHVKKATVAIWTDQAKPSKDLIKKIVKKADENKDAEVAETISSPLPLEVSNTPVVPHLTDVASVFDTPAANSTNKIPAIVAPISKDLIKNGGKGFQSPLKKAAAKPAPVDTNTSTVLQKPIVLPASVTPIKRAQEGALTPPPDLKRIKTDIVPPLTPTYVLRSITSSPCPRSPSMEAQVAEQRKRLQAIRNKRAEMVNRKAAMEQKLAPYKKRMTEELERLRQETAEAEAEMAADEEEYLTSEAMLAEFEQGDGGF